MDTEREFSDLIARAKSAAELHLLLEVFLRWEKPPAGSASALLTSFKRRFDELQRAEREQFEAALDAFNRTCADDRKIVQLRS